MRLRANQTVVLTALAVTAVDAVSKAWARSTLAGGPRHIVGAIWLQLRYNTGLSFSFNAHGASWVSYVSIAIALAVVAVGLRATPGVATVGFGLVIGGGVANLIDRVMASPHEVTDFVAVGALPTFNLADAALTIGTIVLLVAALRGERLIR